MPLGRRIGCSISLVATRSPNTEVAVGQGVEVTGAGFKCVYMGSCSGSSWWNVAVKRGVSVTHKLPSAILPGPSGRLVLHVVVIRIVCQTFFHSRYALFGGGGLHSVGVIQLQPRCGWCMTERVPYACLATNEAHVAALPELLGKVLVSGTQSVRPNNRRQGRPLAARGAAFEKPLPPTRCVVRGGRV